MNLIKRCIKLISSIFIMSDYCYASLINKYKLYRLSYKLFKLICNFNLLVPLLLCVNFNDYLLLRCDIVWLERKHEPLFRKFFCCKIDRCANHFNTWALRKYTSISVVICDAYFGAVDQVIVVTLKLSKSWDPLVQ